MNTAIDKPITIQIIDESTEEWTDLYNLHAAVNKSRSDDQYLGAGSERTRNALVFEVRYFKALEEIRYSHELYRILYRGKPYMIEDYDDYREHHKTVKFLGVSY